MLLCNYALQGGVGGDVWVYACLPVWLASSGNVEVCTLEPRGPPDVSEREVGGTFGSSGSGLVLQVCLVRAGSLQAWVLSTSISLSFRSRSSAWCPHPVLTSRDRPFGDTKKKKVCQSAWAGQSHKLARTSPTPRAPKVPEYAQDTRWLCPSPRPLAGVCYL